MKQEDRGRIFVFGVRAVLILATGPCRAESSGVQSVGETKGAKQ